MTYAEQFKVGSWLEEPARWLQWAAASLNQGNLTDAGYNLQQFWSALSPLKAQARTSKDWGEVETLDGLSQWNLGRLYQAQASDALKRLNDWTTTRYGGAMATLLPLGIPIAAGIEDWFRGGDGKVDQAVNWLAGKADPYGKNLAASIKDLGAKADAALSAAKALADKARNDLQAAGASDEMARRVAVVATGTGNIQRGLTAGNNQMASSWATPDAPKIDFNFFGIPWWAWAAGAGVLVLAFTAGPEIVAAAPEAYAARALRRRLA